MVIWSLNLVYTAAWSVESGPLKCITNSFFPKLSTMNGLLNIRVQVLWFETLSHTLHGEEVRGDASPRCRSGLSIGAVFSCHPPLFTSPPRHVPTNRLRLHTKAIRRGHLSTPREADHFGNRKLTRYPMYDPLLPMKNSYFVVGISRTDNQEEDGPRRNLRPFLHSARLARASSSGH